MELSVELQDLMAARELLEKKSKELLSAPMSFYRIVHHAEQHVDRMIDSYLRGEAQ